MEGIRVAGRLVSPRRAKQTKLRASLGFTTVGTGHLISSQFLPWPGADSSSPSSHLNTRVSRLPHAPSPPFSRSFRHFPPPFPLLPSPFRPSFVSGACLVVLLECHDSAIIASINSSDSAIVPVPPWWTPRERLRRNPRRKRPKQ
jgi:hypothetical protein